MTLTVESLPVEKLQLDPSNARKHSDANLSAIAESLKQFGQRKPIVITAENVVVAGNGTFQAACGLGFTHVDVVRVPMDWSANQVKAFALADNRTGELAEWNSEILLEQLFELETSGFEVSVMGFDGVAFQPDVFEPVDEAENPRLDQRTRQECPNCKVSLEIVKGVLVQHD